MAASGGQRLLKRKSITRIKNGHFAATTAGSLGVAHPAERLADEYMLSVVMPGGGVNTGREYVLARADIDMSVYADVLAFCAKAFMMFLNVPRS